MRKDVVLDCDGVLFDFEGLFGKTFGWEKQDIVCLESRYPDKAYEIDLFVLSSKTYEQLDVLDLGVRIARFCENEKFRIHVVSSRPSHALQTTGVELKRNKIPMHYLSVDDEWRSPKVGRIANIQPLFIVDDMLSVVEKCADLGIPAFLIDQPWNQKDDLDGIIYRVKTFDEFLSKFNLYFDVC